MVVLDDMVVSHEEDAEPWSVMDEVLGGPVAATRQLNSHALLVANTHVVDVIVVGVIAGGGECDAIPTLQYNPATADVVHVIADGSVVLAPVDRDGVAFDIANIAKCTTGNKTVGCFLHHNGRPTATLQGHAAESDFGGAGGETDQGLDGWCQETFSLKRCGGPEIECGGPIEIPLSGCIKFLKQVLDEVSVVRSDGVGAIFGKRDGAGGIVHGLERDDVVPPVEAGINEDLRFFWMDPVVQIRCLGVQGMLILPGYVLVHGDKGPIHVGPPPRDGVDWIGVGVSRQGLAFAIKEELAEIDPLESLCYDIRFEDPVFVGHEPRDGAPAGQDHFLAGA